MFETLFIKAIRRFLSYLSDPVGDISLTYHSELIDEAYEAEDQYEQCEEIALQLLL